MKLLVVIGSGGREHALAWKLAQSPRVQKVFVAPGNGGTATENGVENVPLSGIEESGRLFEEGKDPFDGGRPGGAARRRHRRCVPRRGAEDLRPDAPRRSSKRRRTSPRASWRATRSRPPRIARSKPAEAAKAYVAERGAPIVVKADGLAAGKGVVVAASVPKRTPRSTG